MLKFMAIQRLYQKALNCSYHSKLAWNKDNSVPYDRVKRIWYLSHMRAAKVQASLRIRAVSPEPPLLAHTRKESRGTFSQKARSLASLNGWACAVKICHDGMLEDTNSLDGTHIVSEWRCFACDDLANFNIGNQDKVSKFFHLVWIFNGSS